MQPKVDRADLPEAVKKLRGEGVKWIHIPDQLGYPETTCRRAFKELGEPDPMQPVRVITAPEKDRYTKDLMRQICISGDGVLTSDWHLPLTDYDLADRMCREAQAYGLTDYLVIAGDYFNHDALSQHSPKQDDAGLAEEISDANDLMQQLLSVFDRIYITLGNHDERLQVSLGYRLKFEHSIRMCFYELTPEQHARIHVTGLDHIMVSPKPGAIPWRVCHTRSYSRQPLTFPRKLTNVYRCHVAAGHRHHHASGWGETGVYRAIELGGFFDASKTHYLQRYTTDFPQWCQGYVLLMDGEPYCPLLSPFPKRLQTV